MEQKKYKRQTPVLAIDNDAPLKGIDRSRKAGFKKYWSERQDHFKSLYGMAYTEESAEEAFRVIKKMGFDRLSAGKGKVIGYEEEREGNGKDSQEVSDSSGDDDEEDENRERSCGEAYRELERHSAELTDFSSKRGFSIQEEEYCQDLL